VRKYIEETQATSLQSPVPVGGERSAP